MKTEFVFRFSWKVSAFFYVWRTCLLWVFFNRYGWNSLSIVFLSTTVSKHIFYSVCCCIYSRYIIISLGYLISTHKEHNKTFRNWKARSCLCSDLILNVQFRLFNQTNPIMLFFFYTDLSSPTRLMKNLSTLLKQLLVLVSSELENTR